MTSLSIVIPAFNERESIESVVADALRVGADVSAVLEVVVCDDGSQDGTGDLLLELAAREPRLRVLRRRANRGIEASIAALYAAARHELIFLISADRQWPMTSLLEMLRVLEERNADIVVGRRRNKREVYTVYRRFVSVGYEAVVRALGAPVGDPGSIKLGRAEALREPIVSRGVFAEGERLIRAARRGRRLVECDVAFLPRRTGKATGARFRVVSRAAFDAIRVACSLLLGRPAPRPPSLDPAEWR